MSASCAESGESQYAANLPLRRKYVKKGQRRSAHNLGLPMQPSATIDKRPLLQGVKDDLQALRKGPIALWLIFAVKFLESVAHFAIYNVLAVYLTEDLHYDDIAAGTIAGTWLTAVSVVMFFSGFIADAVGIRRAMLLAVSSCLLGRLVMTVGRSDPLIPVVGLFITTWGVAALLPTMTAAVRRYTTVQTVAFGFSLFYVIMNVGALVAPQTVSFMRTHVKGGVDVAGYHLTSSQTLFALATLVTLFAALVTLLLPVNDNPTAEQAPAGPPKPAATRNPMKILTEVMQDRQFFGFLLFVSLLVLVRLIFQHAHLTWPKYTLREVDKDFDFAGLWSLNPALVIVLTPFVTAFTKRLSAFWCIVTGSFISASSVFFLVLSASMPAQIAFVAVLSIGECLWSPRLYEYTATVAAPGREASYMGLSQIPMFFAKPVVGWTSGWMLATWCPATGPRDSSFMWLIVGLTTLAGPIAIIAFRKVIEGGNRKTAEVPT